jgi:hypothetical protein
MSYETLNTRLDYLGGTSLARINKQKLKSFRATLANDYNSRTILTPLGEKWQCLINDDNTKSDYDKRFLSVEFDSQLEAGDTFECIDDGIHWMVYLPDIVETAYLKAEIIACRYQMTVNDTDYWIYFQGPVETDIRWNLKDNVNWNELNLSATIYIKKNEETLKYFNRFTQIQVAGHTWEIQTVDTLTVPGIIELELEEYFESPTDNLITKEETTPSEYFEGKTEVYPYSTYTYKMLIDEEGIFSISNDKAKIISQEDGKCQVEITASKKGEFSLIYTTAENEYILDIKILSL